MIYSVIRRLFFLFTISCCATLVSQVPALAESEVGTNDMQYSQVGSTGDDLRDAFDPQVAYNSTNDLYLIVWMADDADDGLLDNELEIYGQLVNGSDGTEAGAEFRLTFVSDSNTDFDARDPAVAYNSASNEFLVVYTADRIVGEQEIYGQRINASNGSLVGSPIRVSDVGTDGDTETEPLQPEVVYNSTDNEYFVIWSADETVNEFEIYGQRITAAGAETGTNDIRISNRTAVDNTYDSFNPHIAHNSTDNEYLVVFRGSATSSSDREIFLQRLSATGAEVGTDTQITDLGGTTTGFDADNPTVAYNSADNEYLVVFIGSDDASGGWVAGEREVVGQRVSSTGAELGTNDFRITNVGPDGDANFDAFDPRIQYDPVRNSYAIFYWGEDEGINGAIEVYVQRVNASGADIGHTQLKLSDMGASASDTAFRGQDAWGVYNSTQDEFFVVWEGEDDTAPLVDNEFEIFGQRLGLPVVSVSGNGITISDGDTTPNTTDFTDFGNVAVSSSESRQFAINNSGGGDLILDGSNPYIAISGTNAADFSVTAAPSATVNGSGGSSAFTIQFAPSTTGVREALISFQHDDRSSPYTFSVQGTGGNPEIAVEGNSVSIADGDSTPDSSDHTFFGSTSVSSGTINRTFTISNSGTADLSLSGSPRVAFSSGDTGDFSVVSPPSASIAPASTSTFEISFDPTTSGTRQVTVSIDNNDSDENPFDFVISGEGVVGTPEIDVQGNSQSITDGDTTPDTSDHTDFGAIVAGSSSAISRTFTISNTGTADLTLTGSPSVQLSGSGALDFAVTAQPSTPVTQSGTTTFTIEFSRTSVGTSSATVSIENDDSDENPYSLAIQGVASLDTDGDGIPDATDSDDDNDGVSDNQEMSDGTNPLDPGSSIEQFGSEVCVEWNGFLDFLTQIFELRNRASAEIAVDVTLYDIAGAAQETVRLFLDPGIQRDVIVNNMTGFAANTYGLVCGRIVSGPTDALGGQLVTYRFNGSSYTLAFASEFLPARSGAQYFTYNTYQPSLDPNEISNFVANWVQLVNDETSTQTGTLRYYDFEGNEIRTETVAMGPRERQDIDIHTVGAFRSGLVCWEPDDSAAKFRIRQNRYYYGVAGLSELVEAASLPGKRGTGEALLAPFDTSQRTVALEISNTLTTGINVTTVVRDANGVNTPQQPPVLALPAKGTRGIVLNEYLAAALGSVQISANTSGSLIVNIVEYGRGTAGSLLYANPGSPQEPLGTDLRGSYNSFLGQACRLRAASVSGAQQDVQLNMTRFDGASVISGQTVTIPANGTVEVDLCSSEAQEAYGEVQLQASTSAVVAAEVVRRNAEGTVEFATPLKP